jgi:hypothetical protein
MGICAWLLSVRAGEAKQEREEEVYTGNGQSGWIEQNQNRRICWFRRGEREKNSSSWP